MSSGAKKYLVSSINIFFYATTFGTKRGSLLLCKNIKPNLKQEINHHRKKGFQQQHGGQELTKCSLEITLVVSLRLKLFFKAFVFESIILFCSLLEFY